MIYYPLGETPAEQPQWLQDELKQHGLDPQLPVWLLDGDREDWSVPAAYLFQMPPNYPLFRHGHPCCEGPDGSVEEADFLKHGALPPEFVPF